MTRSPLVWSTTSSTRWIVMATTGAMTSTRTVPSASSATWPASTKASRIIPPTPGPSRQAAITLTHADAITIVAAADIAADDKRYRLEMCPDCPDQSCPDCRTNLHDIEAFDQMAKRVLRAAQAAPAAAASRPGPDRWSQPAADREAGQ